ncbi:unnamed protein product [Enterobius vermicularis]|uniref:FH2 domain-containing protein n=1 Tax=Enterobius vermicularis TaxID=51028 RepID=A0A0N4VMK6_ENTVE|nr:unnamed protein product [Enterobius vermicularis]
MLELINNGAQKSVELLRLVCRARKNDGEPHSALCRQLFASPRSSISRLFPVKDCHRIAQLLSTSRVDVKTLDEFDALAKMRGYSLHLGEER